MKNIALTILVLFWCGCLIAEENDAENQRSTYDDQPLIQRSNEIMAIRLSIEPVGQAPQTVPTTSELLVPAPMSTKSIEFGSSDFVYRRLLFEQPLLERHGATRNELTQPLVSGAHFLGRTALFPLDLVIRRNRKCDSSLGWGTPGSPNLNCRR